jgi:hypothetical protein
MMHETPARAAAIAKARRRGYTYLLHCQLFRSHLVHFIMCRCSPDAAGSPPATAENQIEARVSVKMPKAPVKLAPVKKPEAQKRKRIVFASSDSSSEDDDHAVHIVGPDGNVLRGSSRSSALEIDYDDVDDSDVEIFPMGASTESRVFVQTYCMDALSEVARSPNESDSATMRHA